MAYPNGKKHYADLSNSEKWTWHTGIYAFRHVRLDAPIEAGKSPHDPNGEWFDRGMIEAEVRKMRMKQDEAKRDRRVAKDVELQRQGRDIVNKWAQEHGFSDIDDYCERTNQPWVNVYTEIIQEICANTPHESGILFPARIGHFRSLADCIGGGGKRQPPERAEPAC